MTSAWGQYFATQGIPENDPTALELIFRWTEYFAATTNPSNTPLPVSLSWPHIPQDLQFVCLHSFTIAICTARYALQNPSAIIRLVDVPPVPTYATLSSSKLGCVVCIRGVVTSVSNIAPRCVSVPFQCASCGTVSNIALSEGIFRYPSHDTAACGCQGRVHTPVLENAICVDVQTMRVQECHNSAAPTTLDVSIEDEDLMGKVRPGDIVHVTGLLDVSCCASKGPGGKRTGAAMKTLIIRAHNIVPESMGPNGASSKGGITSSIKSEDLDVLADALMRTPDLSTHLSLALAPTITGHTEVKLGMLLSLVGAGDAESERNIHVLILGPAGVGKSQMLRAVSTLVPHGVFVCGSTTSGAGLGVCWSRSTRGSAVLDAGALVIGNGGVTCIDEVDKLNDCTVLLEAMDRQRISVAKASVLHSVETRTAIIAAGNFGKQMSPQLMSRFDLQFAISARSAEAEQAICRHVMSLHSRQQHSSSSGGTGSNTSAIPVEVLRVVLARLKEIVVTFSPEAQEAIRDAYVSQRASLPPGTVTLRRLHSLRRLSAAHCRSNNRCVVIRDDVMRVLDLMDSSKNYETAGNDATGRGGGSTRTANGGGQPLSKAKQREAFVEELRLIVRSGRQNKFDHRTLTQIMCDLGVKSGQEEFLRFLNTQGQLLLDGPAHYRVKL